MIHDISIACRQRVCRRHSISLISQLHKTAGGQNSRCMLDFEKKNPNVLHALQPSGATLFSGQNGCHRECQDQQPRQCLDHQAQLQLCSLQHKGQPQHRSWWVSDAAQQSDANGVPQAGELPEALPFVHLESNDPDLVGIIKASSSCIKLWPCWVPTA